MTARTIGLITPDYVEIRRRFLGSCVNRDSYRNYEGMGGDHEKVLGHLLNEEIA